MFTEMKSIVGRSFGLLTVGMAVMTHLKVKSGSLDPSLLAAAGKAISQALAPATVAAGIAGMLHGIRRRDGLAIATGLVGAVVAADYVRRVTAAQNTFATAFGADWEQRIPPQQAARLSHRRYAGYLLTRSRPRFTRDVRYSTLAETGRDLLCDIWEPPDGMPRSGLAMVYLHGGGWQNLDKDNGTRPFFSRLAVQGHVVMDVSYRQCHETDLWGMVGDAKRAVAWIKEHSADYGVDPQRVVLAGGSAGGHLALLAGYTPSHPRLTPPDLEGVDTSVRGVLAFYAPADLSRYSSDGLAPDWPLFIQLGKKVGFLTAKDYLGWAEVEQRLLGGRAREVPDVAALYSPITHVRPGCPTTMLIYGTHDGLVPVADERALYECLIANAVPAARLELPMVDHGFDLTAPQVSPAAQAALHDAERFLALMAGDS